MTTWVCTRQGELHHHGIKGQKWGVRRFQNEDGSLTPAGKKRYDEPNSHSDKKEKQYKIPQNKSLHRLKLEDKYKQQGFSKEEAEQKAAKRIKTEMYVAAAAAVTVASCVAYAKYKGYTSDKTIKSNSEFQRIMRLAENAEIREGRQYLSFDKRDRIKYKGILGDSFHNQIEMDEAMDRRLDRLQKSMNQRAKNMGFINDIPDNKVVKERIKERVYDVTVKNKGDINIASRKRAEDAFLKLYKEDSDFRDNLLQRVKETGVMGGDKLGNNGTMSDRRLRKYGYDAFNILLVDTDNKSTSNANKFYDVLRKQGINAIVDVNDKKYSGYKAKMPIITFDGNFEYTKRAMEKTEIAKNNKKAMAMITTPELMKSGAIYAGMFGASPVITKATVEKRVLLYKDEHPNTKMTDSEIREMVKKELTQAQK